MMIIIIIPSTILKQFCIFLSFRVFSFVFFPVFGFVLSVLAAGSVSCACLAECRAPLQFVPVFSRRVWTELGVGRPVCVCYCMRRCVPKQVQVNVFLVSLRSIYKFHDAPKLSSKVPYLFVVLPNCTDHLQTCTHQKLSLSTKAAFGVHETVF